MKAQDSCEPRERHERTYMRGGTSPATAAPKKRLGVGGGFALGCRCKDAKAVAVAVVSSSASPHSATATTTEASTATWRRVMRPSASGSTGTLTVASASSSSSSFPWEDVEADGDGEEVNCTREASTNAPSLSALLTQLNELEQSVASLGRKSTSKRYYFSPPPAPPPSPPPSRPVTVKQRAVHSGERHYSKEGHGNFSPPPPPPPPSFWFQTQKHRKAKSMDNGDRQEGSVLFFRQLPPPPSSLPLLPEKPPNTKITDKGSKKKGVDKSPPPQHRKAKSFDDGGACRFDGTVAVVKHSDDPLSDFRRSMVNMIVEKELVTGDELRELLRHFLALNAPHHHDTILRAFTEIRDKAFFSTRAHHREPSSDRLTPPRQRATSPLLPPHRCQQTTRVWR